MPYLTLLEENKDKLIQSLQELIQIDSSQGEKEGAYPFGQGVQKAFEYMLDLGRSEGFTVKNVDNFGGHIEFPGYLKDEEGELLEYSEEIFGVLVHLDVVPAGSDWTKEPFGGEIEDGKLYGRGAIDDKGPAMAAFYAMKALKDSGFVPSKTIRLILGLDEETNWIGMGKYLEKEKAPDLGFTPDADFPVIHGEKGILVFELAKKPEKVMGTGLELRSLSGGSAANMVADSARALLRNTDPKATGYEKIRDLARAYEKETGYKIGCKGVGKSFEVSAKGISSHGARPEQGLNAISILMDFLSRLTFVNEDINDFIDFYRKHIGFELDGRSLGCAMSDGPSGDLILNVGLVNYDRKTLSLTVNIRYPVTLTGEAVYEAMLPVINKYNLGIIKIKNSLPLYMPEDEPMILTLMEVYREFTGDMASSPLVIGGGTYARVADNLVAYGATFPGEEEVAHQKDEYINIESLMTSAKIYGEALARLTK